MALSGTEIELAKFVCQQAQLPSAKREADADQWQDQGFQPKRNKKRGNRRAGATQYIFKTLVCVVCVLLSLSFESEYKEESRLNQKGG